MLLPYYLQAFKGLLLWGKTEKKYGAEHYILMPETNNVYNYYTLLHLNEFMESNHLQDVLILTHDKGVLKSFPLFATGRMVRCLWFSPRKTDALIRYYGLYAFTLKLTIVSFKKPYDTCSENLLGRNGVTKEDLICFDMYKLGKTMHIEPPIYEDSDTDICHFMRLGEKNG